MTGKKGMEGQERAEEKEGGTVRRESVEQASELRLDRQEFEKAAKEFLYFTTDLTLPVNLIAIVLGTDQPS